MGRKQGFIFTVLALAVLALIVLSVGIWVLSFEQKEYRQAQSFKGEAVRSILSSISDQSLTDFANASAFFAFYKLADYSAYQGGIAPNCTSAPPATFPENNCTANVENYAKSLMENGRLPSNIIPQLAYTPEENSSYGLGAWMDKVKRSAAVMGFNVTFSSPRNFTVKQDSPWTIRVQFNLDMNISDNEKTVFQEKALFANASFPIESFLDPMIPRNELILHGGSVADPAIKQVWRHEHYASPSSVAPVLLAQETFQIGRGYAEEGNGWFFGPFTSDLYPSGIFDSGADPNALDRINQYVLVTSINDANQDAIAGVANLYGAVVLTTQPGYNSYDSSVNGCSYTISEQTQCLNCMRQYTLTDPNPACPALPSIIYGNAVDVPVIVATNVNWSNIPQIGIAGSFPNNQRYVLIDNEHDEPLLKRTGYHRVWDITLMRDMAICGFYVHDETKAAPSYFQRMLAGNPRTVVYGSKPLGIESFVVGRWAGGALDSFDGSYPTDYYSRLDWEFYSTDGSGILPPTYRVKGMMGCKGKSMCISSNTNTTQYSVGKFRLRADSLARYGALPLIYNEGDSPTGIPDLEESLETG
jgi:hypothetical protein